MDIQAGYVLIAEDSYNRKRGHMHEIVIGVGAIVSLLAAFWGITWKMSDAMDKKMGRMYQRFDEYKEHLEGTHVRREVCNIMHEQLRNDVTEIKKDVKDLLKLANGKSKQ